MDVTKLVAYIISLTIGVIIIATVLIPTIDGLTIEDTTLKTLFGVVSTLAVLSLVMVSVRMLSDKF